MTQAPQPSMPELIYLLKVAESAAPAVVECLKAPVAPTHVRVATLAPLSNYGFRPDAAATLLDVSAHGLVFGSEAFDDVPRAFVPWTNVAYLADGTALGKRREQAAQAKAGTVTLQR